MVQYNLEIHASRLDDYSDCPLRGFADLLAPELKKLGYEVRELPNYITPEVGTAIHAGVAQLHTSSTPYNRLIAIDVAQTEIRRIVQNNAAIRFTQKMPDWLFIDEHIINFIDAYHQQVFKQRPAALVEHHLEGRLSESITYKTTLDLLTTNHILADLKSGAKLTPAYNQLGFYILLLQREGYRVDRAILDYVQPDKVTKEYTHRPIEYDRDTCLFMVKQTLTSLFADFEVFCETNNLDHIRANPRSAGCNIAMCPLYTTTTCHLWQSEKK